MSLGTAMRVHQEQEASLHGGVGKVVSDAAYSMKVTDTMIFADGTDNVVVLTLPAKDEAAGKFYFITALNASNDVSVNEKENATEISTYGDLDTAEDAILLFSTGREWAVVWSSIT